MGYVKSEIRKLVTEHGSKRAARSFADDWYENGRSDRKVTEVNNIRERFLPGKIYSFEHSPDTICDGVMTLHIADITFKYLKKLDDFIEVKEDTIIYWTQWLTHLLKINIEPSSALAMTAAVEYINKNSFEKAQKILIVLSGGNVAADKHRLIWQKDYLAEIPSLSSL